MSAPDPDTWILVSGPFDTEAEAEAVANRLNGAACRTCPRHLTVSAKAIQEVRDAYPDEPMRRKRLV